MDLRLYAKDIEEELQAVEDLHIVDCEGEIPGTGRGPILNLLAQLQMSATANFLPIFILRSRCAVS